MRTSFLLLGLMIAIAAGSALSSCSKDETTNPPENTEFIAQDADFSNFTAWTKVVGPLNGPDPAGLLSTGAHSGDDSSISRTVFINNASATRGSNGEFPNGTILVKELKMADGTIPMITAMAKRGGEFNKTYKGWEWFMLDPATNKVMTRADTLMGGTCNGCHNSNADKDLVFTK